MPPSFIILFVLNRISGSAQQAPVQPWWTQVEEPAVEINARVLVEQTEADVLPAGGVLRGAAEAHQRELRRGSHDRSTGTGDEVYHRCHRELRLRHTDKRIN